MILVIAGMALMVEGVHRMVEESKNPRTGAMLVITGWGLLVAGMVLR